MSLLDQPLIKEINVFKKERALEAKANRLLKVTKTRRGKKKKHKRKIPFMAYQMYIGSAYWKKRKNDYFGKYGKKCAICGKKNGVTLHHKKYDNKLNGKEPDDFFVALCPHHHYVFHMNYQVKENMVKETEEYVFTLKQLENSNIENLDWIT